MPRGADTFLTHASQGLFAIIILSTWFAPPILAQDPSAVKRFDVVLGNGRVTGGPPALRVVRGDQVDILWTSDRVVTLHLHGYDIEVTTAPGSPQRMMFTARATGRFPIEIHSGAERHRTLIHVEVHPR
jgi:hypothetical protein